MGGDCIVECKCREGSVKEMKRWPRRKGSLCVIGTTCTANLAVQMRIGR